MREASRKAAELSPTKGLDPETVRSRARYVPVAFSGPTTLGVFLENYLVRLIQAFSTEKRGLSGVMLRDLAKMLSPDNGSFGKGWLRRFMRRHEGKIKLRKAKDSHSRKIVLEAFPKCVEWAKETQKVVDTEAYDASCVVNIDESAALTGDMVDKLISSVFTNEVQYKAVVDFLALHNH